ncbi:MFS transporter [Catenuloplanes atrovinosus]|uniref:MFS family arabinose efflux permease n=1 Tax=Catenuloplanes atrovinosus TaxID=137266 RepID=A0AAE3YMN9_9ACTN|nr:MFS transporter [Catenuloplanes atrovinosus]MDR7274983.1 putative MFS family arabinose efflux permease [Catenuloplanes atrovinosus]
MPLFALLGAGFISLTGDWILRTGLAWQVYALTGSTLAAAGTVLASLIPQTLLGPPAGVRADRGNRRHTMIAVNLLLALCLIPLLAVTSADRVWIIWPVVAAQSCLVPFFVAAESALLPSLAGAHGLVRANALNAQVRDVARLTGAGIGGAVAAAGGLPLLAAVDAASFLAAAALLVAVPARAGRVPATGHDPDAGRGWRDLTGGLRLISRSPALRVFGAFFVITGVGEAIMATLMAPFVRDVLHASATAYGTVLAAQAIGGLAGGAAVALAGHRISPWPAAAWGAVAFGAADLALFLYPLATSALWPAYALIVLAGLPGALLAAAGMTIVQTAAGPAHRGRVFGTFLTLEALAMLAGTLTAGALGDHLGIIPVIAAQGAAYCLAGLLLAAASRRATVHRTPAAALAP